MSPTFDMYNPPRSLIEAAYKLRQPVLFKDCVTSLAGTMLSQSKIDHGIKNPDILQAIMSVRDEIFDKVLDAQDLLTEMAYNHRGDKLFKILSDNLKLCTFSSGLHQPLYYRTLSNCSEGFKGALETVLSGRLQLDASCEAGVDLYRNNFFCARLSDDDLPVSFVKIVFPFCIAEIGNFLPFILSFCYILTTKCQWDTTEVDW